MKSGLADVRRYELGGEKPSWMVGQDLVTPHVSKP